MSKAAKTKTAEKFVCPECAKEFQNLAGLRGHLAYKHKAPTKVEKSTKSRSVRVQPKGASTVTPKSSAPEPKPGPESAVSNTGAHEHLKTALLELTQRNRQIDEELARMEGLRAEKEIISKQIDAVNAALQAF
jgi:hypothetical protein